MGNCQSVDQTKILVPRQGPVNEINIYNCIWSRKYLGLYDYQARQVLRKKFKIQGNAVIMKEAEKLIVLNQKIEKLTRGPTENYKNSIFRLIRTDNYYQIIPIVYQEKQELIQRPIWLVVKTLPGRNYCIKERDIIKLGKQKLKVRQVVPTDYNQSAIMANSQNIRVSKPIYEQLRLQQNLNIEETQSINLEQPQELTKPLAIDQAALQGQQDIICRICLQPGLITNPLITPCKCSGSVKYIHLLCLKMWLSKQIKAVINDFCVTINWRPLSCEMCQTHYKYRIYLDNQKFYTVDIPKPQKPYIVVEIMKKKNKQEGKIFKFITFKNKNKINIGRKKDVDVRISDDISVSRVHATLKYKEDTREFILEDNSSKFGTLILAKNGLNIRPHHAGISVQIGAELFEFEAIREATERKIAHYELGNDYLRAQESQYSQNEEQQNPSEEQDEVMELPIDQGDNSPLRRSPSIRRSQSLQSQSHL